MECSYKALGQAIGAVRKWWVDIEEEYYKQLKSLTLNTPRIDIDAIRKLHEDLTGVEDLLCADLNKQLSNKTQSIASIQRICDKQHGVNVKEFSMTYNRQVKEILKQCLEQERDYGNTEMIELIRSTKILKPSKAPDITESCDNYTYKNFDFEKIVADFEIKHEIPSTLFLNFNYTTTPKQYINHNDGDKIINIHGTLNDENNPIIFGYGDEAGEDYAKLENTNIDEVLKKIKSQHYLLNGNNRELMNFMESDHYQVIILGHSCGNSDRTLLKALFEHENCVSIKLPPVSLTQLLGEQIKGLANSYLAKDEIEIGYANQIPLYIFGPTYSVSHYNPPPLLRPFSQLVKSIVFV